MPALDWVCSRFAELDRDQLYALLRLRAEVFVVEQDCAYQDLDDHDQQSLHLCGMAADQLACYARISPPGLKLRSAAISRVIVGREYRGSGLGHLLLEEAVAHCNQRWPGSGISLSAQRHLVDFYASRGFRQISEPYDEHGIPHVDMLR